MGNTMGRQASESAEVLLQSLDANSKYKFILRFSLIILKDLGYLPAEALNDYEINAAVITEKKASEIIQAITKTESQELAELESVITTEITGWANSALPSLRALNDSYYEILTKEAKANLDVNYDDLNENEQALLECLDFDIENLNAYRNLSAAEQHLLEVVDSNNDDNVLAYGSRDNDDKDHPAIRPRFLK